MLTGQVSDVRFDEVAARAVLQVPGRRTLTLNPNPSPNPNPNPNPNLRVMAPLHHFA